MVTKEDLIRENTELKARLDLAEKWMRREVATSIDRIQKELGRIDILVNNAGAIPTGDIFSVDETRWREAWDLKVFGYINLMRAMYPHMRGRPPKVIVNVLGLAPALLGLPGALRRARRGCMLEHCASC